MKGHFVLFLITALYLCSCNNNENTIKKENTKTSNPIKYNKNIQDEFFGVSFGASKDEIIKKFRNNGLIVDYEYTTDNFLTFNKIGSERFSFGGMDWECLNVFLNNHQFYKIDFYTSHKTKESALSDFNNVFSKVSQKYYLYEEPLNDTTILRKYVGRAYNNQWIMVSCFRYESFSHRQLFGVWLTYGDNTYNMISNEL